MDRPSLIFPRSTRARRTRATVLLAAMTAIVALVGVSCTKNAQAFDSAARVNDTRTQIGLRALAIDDTLVNKAQAWAEHMAGVGSISHSRLSDGAGSDWAVLGENVGMASSTAQMHSMFMNSPAHRANIVSGKFNRIGTGVAQSGGRLYVVQVFAG
ncbi:CAP domain-containing protein [Dermatobacter hominis]|uniref:CAP domain-containing protein n=1 Tax=Dermatobacter hominis TaxID=2884263 RepID=UPI001D1252FF|nr:CAP domain-containing protein [Dermatobacter hominis]UDY35658.1 CAP domain-containing protein [Dermatobacter hominis]